MTQDTAENSKSKKTQKSRGGQSKIGLKDVSALAKEALRSPDSQTRKMGFLYISGLIGAVLVILIGVGWIVFEKRKAARLAELRALMEAEKHVQPILGKPTTMMLGKFDIQLKRNEDDRRKHGSQPSAELEIVLECATDEGCQALETDLHPVRDSVTSVLTTYDRFELVTVEGKSMLKETIMKRLQSQFPHGNITNVYFPNIVFH